jgi:hypothetical protein
MRDTFWGYFKPPSPECYLVTLAQTNFPFLKLLKILFSYTIFKQFFNILATQNQNHCQNWPFLTKDMNYLSFYSLDLSG